MIGRAVVAALRAAGRPVRLHERAQLDLESAAPSAYDELVRGCDSIVHCAALVHRRSAPAELYERVNVRATGMLADAARRQGVSSFVFLSTIGVYGAGPFERVREDAPLRPATLYAASKQRGEEAVRAAGLGRTIILRPALVFGQGDRGNLLALMRLIDRGLYRHIAGNAAQKSLTSAAYLASIIRCCLEKLPAGEHVLNAALPQPVGVVELADLIASCLLRSPPRTAPRALVRAAAALLGRDEAVRTLSTTTTCAVDRLVSAAGSLPAEPLGEALAEEIRWARGAGLLRPQPR